MVDRAEANQIALAPGGEVYQPRRPVLSRTQRRYRNTRNGRTFVDLLTRSEGATRAEIFAETEARNPRHGWRPGSLSVSGMARDAGLEIFREQRLANGTRRYFGRVPAAPLPQPQRPSAPTIEFTPIAPASDFAGFATYLEMEPDEVNYWDARAATNWNEAAGSR